VLTTREEPNVIIGPVADLDGGSAEAARCTVGIARARESSSNLKREHIEKYMTLLSPAQDRVRHTGCYMFPIMHRTKNWIDAWSLSHIAF
jgi:hypothetical protein